jgi:hypothetical protein
MAQRTERIDNRILVERPVLGDRSSIRKDGIVGMHHPFGLSRRSGGEGKIHDAVGIARMRKGTRRGIVDTAKPDRPLALRNTGSKRLDPVDLLEAG